MGHLTGKRAVSALVAVPALLVMLAATRVWLTGRSADPLLGGGVVSATGSQLAPGVVALAAVAVVGLVATLTVGPRLRRACAVVLALAALGAVALTLPPLLDPVGALGRVAASGLGRTGAVNTTADVSGWAWVGLAAAAVLLAASPVAVVAAGRWSGLSARYEAPGRVPVDRGTRRSAWDELSEGGDPTVRPRTDPARPPAAGPASPGDPTPT
jgi:uncharacterized membrane protein (TIGR02234 family)